MNEHNALAREPDTDDRLQDLLALALRKGTDIAARAMREMEIAFRDHDFLLKTAEGVVEIDPPLVVDGKTVASFRPADALHGTVPAPELERPALRVATLLASTTEVGVDLPMLVSSSQDSRFAEFLRSRRESPDLRTLDGYDDGSNEHPVPGWIYEDHYAIEAATEHWPEEARTKGGFHLVVENHSIVSDDLSDLERRLYDVMVRPDDD